MYHNNADQITCGEKNIILYIKNPGVVRHIVYMNNKPSQVVFFVFSIHLHLFFI
jgi:hypothetical protein